MRLVEAVNVDPVAYAECVRDFVAFVAGSTEHEALAVLATPFLVRLGERATGDLTSLVS